MEQTPIPEDERWTLTCERFVAFLDIMGFKDILIRKSSADIYRMMEGIHEVVSLDNAGIAPVDAMQSAEKMSELISVNGDTLLQGGKAFQDKMALDGEYGVCIEFYDQYIVDLNALKAQLTAAAA